MPFPPSFIFSSFLPSLHPHPLPYFQIFLPVPSLSDLISASRSRVSFSPSVMAEEVMYNMGASHRPWCFLADGLSCNNNLFINFLKSWYLQVTFFFSPDKNKIWFRQQQRRDLIIVASCAWEALAVVYWAFFLFDKETHNSQPCSCPANSARHLLRMVVKGRSGTRAASDEGY